MPRSSRSACDGPEISTGQRSPARHGVPVSTSKRASLPPKNCEAINEEVLEFSNLFAISHSRERAGVEVVSGSVIVTLLRKEGYTRFLI